MYSVKVSYWPMRTILDEGESGVEDGVDSDGIEDGIEPANWLSGICGLSNYSSCSRLVSTLESQGHSQLSSWVTKALIQERICKARQNLKSWLCRKRFLIECLQLDGRHRTF
jgi:hypothetical protein